MNDDLIQKLLDEGHNDPILYNGEGETYRYLYEYLNEHPSYTVPSGFAHKVTARLQTEKETSSSGIFLPIFSGFFVMVICLIAVLSYFGIAISIEFDFSTTLIGMTIVGGVLMFAYRFIEKKYLKSTGEDGSGDIH